jgi:hypothetical protein
VEKREKERAHQDATLAAMRADLAHRGAGLSGGSTPHALALYGIKDHSWADDDELTTLVNFLKRFDLL